MQADPQQQRRLLDLASIDKSLNQLHHQRRSLPELAQIAEADSALESLRSQQVDIESASNDLGREMRRLESDIDGVEQRQARNQQRLDSGAVANARDLESLQRENATLQRRQTNLEDEQLELMEQAEQLEAQLAQISEQQTQVTATREEAVGQRDAQWAELDRQIADQDADRADVVSALDADLVGLYERIRETGVTAAAELTQRRCDGCRIDLSGSDLAGARDAAADDVLRCDSCRCILVRTEKSGL